MNRIDLLRKRLTVDEKIPDYEGEVQSKIATLEKPNSPVATTADKVLSVAVPIAGIIESIASRGGVPKATKQFAEGLMSGRSAKAKDFEVKTKDFENKLSNLESALQDARKKALESRLLTKKDILDTEKAINDIAKSEYEMNRPTPEAIKIAEEERVKKNLEEKTAQAGVILETLGIKDPILKEAARQALISGKGLEDVYTARANAAKSAPKAIDNTKSMDIINGALSDISDIENNPSKEGFFNPIKGIVRNVAMGGKPVPNTKEADLVNSINALKSKLTYDNLVLLKGSMSDKDVEFLTKIGTKLSPTMTKEAFNAELGRVKDIMNRNKSKLSGGSSSTSGTTKKNKVFNPKTGKLE